ncbi:hypothetical protein Scep_021494 [Stephania cephalantha]|uniref:Cyclin N-terminal domain-containing protein n=1 Tax=Stephania cephalantha TaxID=152367 RepID=A0AAP0F3I6_9MAGN
MTMNNNNIPSFSDCLADLLCDEDARNLIEEQEAPEHCSSSSSSSDLGFPVDIEESIAGFVEGEGEYVPRFNYPARFHSRSLDASARRDSIAWILKDIGSECVNGLVIAWCVQVHAVFRFQPLTAYLSVNYMDRFLASRVLPVASEWALQLLAVACLSLAAKMEEAEVPRLGDLQMESTKLVFDAGSVQRMEFLVLGALDWRLRSVTPFTFIDYFAYKVDSTCAFTGLLVSKATQIILSIITDVSFLDYRPSSVAAAAILSATHEIPSLSLDLNAGNAVEWCRGLRKDSILSCYQLIQKKLLVNVVGKRSSPPKVLPQLRVRPHETSTTDSGDSTPSSTSPSSTIKRRKLNSP